MEELKNLLSKIVGSKYNSTSDSNIVNDQTRLQNLLGKQNSDKFMDNVMAFNSDSNTSGAWQDKLQQFLNDGSGDPGKPGSKSNFTPAEQKIVDQYTQKGFIVSKDDKGQLQFKKNPNAPSASSTQVNNVPVTQQVQLQQTQQNNKDTIPLPDYKNPESRKSYAMAFTQKHGPLMSGRGDTPLRIHEIPSWGRTDSKQMAINSAKTVGLDPALLYSSAMEEGMSGLYADSKGMVNTWSENKDYPVSGYKNLGVDNFYDAYPGLVKKGYLPADFKNQFVKSPHTNEKGESVNSADFKTPEAGMQAKAAMVRASRDEIDDYATKNNIKLSPKARDFFMLVSYNAGEGNAQKMMKSYNQKGYLKNDDFLNKRPDESWAGPYENVMRRLKMRDALKQETYFD